MAAAIRIPGPSNFFEATPAAARRVAAQARGAACWEAGRRSPRPGQRPAGPGLRTAKAGRGRTPGLLGAAAARSAGPGRHALIRPHSLLARPEPVRVLGARRRALL